MYSLYLLTDPRPDAPYAYVGVTKQTPEHRLYQHIHDAPNRAMRDWISALQKQRQIPRITVLDTGTGDDMRIAEQDVLCMVKALHGPFCLNKESKIKRHRNW